MAGTGLLAILSEAGGPATLIRVLVTNRGNPIPRSGAQPSGKAMLLAWPLS
jgi:hypothetical protein